MRPIKLLFCCSLLLLLFSQCKEKIDDNKYAEATIDGTRFEFSSFMSKASDIYPDHFGLVMNVPGKGVFERIGVSIFPLNLGKLNLCDIRTEECENTPPIIDKVSIHFQVIDLDSPLGSWWNTTNTNFDSYFQITEIGNTHIKGIFQLELFNDDGAEFGFAETIRITDGNFRVPIPN